MRLLDHGFVARKGGVENMAGKNKNEECLIEEKKKSRVARQNKRQIRFTHDGTTRHLFLREHARVSCHCFAAPFSELLFPLPPFENTQNSIFFLCRSYVLLALQRASTCTCTKNARTQGGGGMFSTQENAGFEHEKPQYWSNLTAGMA